jgi:hypothetical protein
MCGFAFFVETKSSIFEIIQFCKQGNFCTLGGYFLSKRKLFFIVIFAKIFVTIIFVKTPFLINLNRRNHHNFCTHHPTFFCSSSEATCAENLGVPLFSFNWKGERSRQLSSGKLDHRSRHIESSCPPNQTLKVQNYCPAAVLTTVLLRKLQVTARHLYCT